jgi:hypothetical protein
LKKSLVFSFLFVAAILLAWSLALSGQTPKTPIHAALAATTTTNTTTSTTPTQIVFTWAYTANVPACPASGTPVNCQSGFTLTDTTTNTTIAAPAVLGPTALTHTYTPSGGLFYGTHTFSLVANGYDGNGAALVSSAITASVTNSVTSLNGPTNLVGVIH